VSEYAEFVVAKSQMAGCAGFEPTFRHPQAFDFQSHMVDWAVRQGRAALFEDCGLGKTLQQFTWAHNVGRETNKPVLILAPLMVVTQSVEEAAKFDFEAEGSLDGKFKTQTGVVVANYERLHYFDPADFGGVVCDESGCLKNFEGARKSEITEFMKKVRYRLLCSATPSPNDYIELGTSSEALGQLGYMDMLGMFFKNDEDTLHPLSMGTQWRFKSHAQRAFWRWVCSWARAIRQPSDVGFDDGPFVLPPLIERDHMVKSPVLEGQLFAMPAQGLAEERAERRGSLTDRCEKAAELHAQGGAGIAWCQLNDEADLLCKLIPGAMQIAGSDRDERKIELFNAFRHGQLDKLVTKPKIMAWGANFQHANYMTMFADHSFEQYYQMVRRMWRFGQKRPVTADTITTEGLAGVTKNLKRKAAAADEMFRLMVEQMNDALGVKRFHEHTNNQDLPTWL